MKRSLFITPEKKLSHMKQLSLFFLKFCGLGMNVLGFSSLIKITMYIRLSNWSRRLSIWSPLELVKNLPLFNWKHFFFEYKQPNLPRGPIRAFISNDQAFAPAWSPSKLPTNLKPRLPPKTNTSCEKDQKKAKTTQFFNFAKLTSGFFFNFFEMLDDWLDRLRSSVESTQDLSLRLDTTKICKLKKMWDDDWLEKLWRWASDFGG